MFINNLKYEIKLLIRNNWLVILIISIVLLFTYATYNGNENVIKRLDESLKMQEQLHKKDSILLESLKKIESGEKLDIPAWQLPIDPMIIGYNYPRLTIMKPGSLSFLSTGQSDMYTHFKSPRVYGDNFALDYAEMINPIQLLFGNFDLAFVIIYILPLLIIAFTFNLLSKEIELGVFKLLGAQPISMMNWLLQKMTVRYAIVTLVCTITLVVLTALFSVNAFKNIYNLIGLLFILASYIFFWFVVAFIINIKVNNSSKNALALIGIWLLVVLILPATINQIGSSLYPTPSRLKMVNEIRQIKKENEEKQDEIMNDYLRTHPELAKNSDKERFGFWHKYFASGKVIEEKNKPLLEQYSLQLKNQQNLISAFKYISPAIIMQQSLNNTAETSEQHYNDYKKQVHEFSNEWRNFLIPMLFKEEKFTSKEFKNMPVFIYENRISNNLWHNLLALIVISCLVLFLIAGKSLKDKSIKTL